MSVKILVVEDNELKRIFYEIIIVRGLIGPAMNSNPDAEHRGILLIKAYILHTRKARVVYG